MSGVNKTRERILDVSADLFRKQGMAGTGIKQILRGADAPFGSLYHHFPGGKDELAAETIKRAGTQYAEPLAHVILSALEGAFVFARASRSTDALDACGEAMATLVETAQAAPARVRRSAARR